MATTNSPLSSFVLTQEEILRYVKAAGENDYIDAKRPCSWEDETTKASLAKDIAAFSNSEGGGAIVVGRAETSDGQFDFTGLTPEQCKSFDTTKVAQWVNNYFSPAIRLTCYPVEYEGKSFVVVAVAEFADKPAICTKDRVVNNKVLLAKGTLYVRNENAESAPLFTPDQVSRLIGRAVVKQQDALRQLLDSVIAGRTAKNIPTDEERFEGQAHNVERDLLEAIDNRNEGAWKFLIHPDTFVERWQTPKELTDIILQSRLGSRRFPQEYPAPLPREWGISGNYNIWGLTHQGMFCYWQRFWENAKPWEVQSIFAEDAAKKLEAGQWLNYAWSVYMVGDFFAFAKRFSELFEAGSQMRYQVVASELKGRHLVLSFGGAELRTFGYPPCAINTFSHTKTLPAGRIASAWKELCADCIVDLVHRFPGGTEHLHRDASVKWVERYAAESGLS